MANLDMFLDGVVIVGYGAPTKAIQVDANNKIEFWDLLE
jgi:hypothetical protein